MKKKTGEQAITFIEKQVKPTPLTSSAAPIDGGKLLPAGFKAPKISPSRPDPAPPAFSPMLQGTGSNKFSQISTRSTTPKIDITGEATVSFDNWELKLDNFNTVSDIRPSTHKLFNACVIALTAQNDYRGNGAVNTFVNFSLDEYMSLCGIPLTKPSKDRARRRLRDDLETLFICRLSWKENKRGKTENFSDIRIISSKEIKSGIIRVGFSPELAQYLTGAYVMQFPRALFRVDERNPSALIIGRKLSLHHGIDNNQRKGTANIISVQALLTECNQTIPNYETVMNSDKHVSDRIIEPLEDALNALNFITWEYSNSKGIPLTDEQLENNTYAEWVKRFILFEINDFPDQTARLEARAEEIKTKAANKKAPTKKKADKPKEKS